MPPVSRAHLGVGYIYEPPNATPRACTVTGVGDRGTALTITCPPMGCGKAQQVIHDVPVGHLFHVGDDTYNEDGSLRWCRYPTSLPGEP